MIAYEPILHFLIRPAVRGQRPTPPRGRTASPSAANCANLYVTSPLDGLSLRVKIAVYGGLVLASPVILFQIWRFVTPGLKAREKKYAVPFVTAAVVLFLLGAATAYVTLSHALGFLRAVGGPDLQQIYDPIPVPRPGPGADGVVRDHLPVPGRAWSLWNWPACVTPARLLRSWRWAVILIVVVAAVFTPSSDPFSMLALAVPLIVFFFISIAIGKLMGR